MSETVPEIIKETSSGVIMSLLLQEQKAAIRSSHKIDMYFILCIRSLIIYLSGFKYVANVDNFSDSSKHSILAT
jgi:hypothetical protein